MSYRRHTTWHTCGICNAIADSQNTPLSTYILDVEFARSRSNHVGTSRGEPPKPGSAVALGMNDSLETHPPRVIMTNLVTLGRTVWAQAGRSKNLGTDTGVKQYNLVPASGWWCLVAGEVIAALAESSGSLPPGLWLQSPAGWLPRTGISSGTIRSFQVQDYLYLLLC